jgi:nanoRNase/pAp phosphatase (c-di-AMP/oligoRNAs hydrolase)
MARERRKRSDRLLEALSNYARVTIVAHDNPDPDAIATGWALHTLLRACTDKPVQFVAGGAIMRAENMRLVELLEPPIELVESLEPQDDTAYALVDCTPVAANHLLSDTDGAVIAVVDHHQPGKQRYRVPHRDVRPKFASSATIAAQYLREQGVEPSKELATALVYAIQTDALGWRAFVRADHRLIAWASRFADYSKLAAVQMAPLRRDYYGDLLMALKSTFLYDDIAVCFLPRAMGQEIVGEVADLLIRCDTVNRVLCAAVVGEQVLLSVRTTDRGGDANALVRRLLRGCGRGGGHVHRAGGKLTAPARGEQVSDETQSELRSRWLEVCGVDQSRGIRLVSRREILNDL